MSNELERRNVINQRGVAKIETREDGKQHCVGYSAVFYRADVDGTQFKLWDNVYERIMPGAFDEIAKDDVRALFNHNASFILGRNVSGTLKLDVDDVGLRYDITLPDTQTARDLIEVVNRGDVSGSSFAFIAVADRWTRETVNEVEREVREVLTVRTMDVGPVTYPAYTATTTDVANRSLDEHQTEQGRAQLNNLRRRAKVQRLRAHNLD